MRAKQLPPLLVVLALMALVTVPAFADPVTAVSVAVGDRYAVTTISGEDRAWVFDS